MNKYNKDLEMIFQRCQDIKSNLINKHNRTTFNENIF